MAESDPAEAVPTPAPGRRLTLLYVLALSTVAILSIGAQRLIQRQLQNGESDSRVINVAGRQRMLSQRLAKAALRLDGPDPAAAGSELEATLEVWANSHEGLREGDAARGLPGANSDEIQRLFAIIEPHFVAMRDAAREVLATPIGKDHPAAAINAIQKNESAFLSGMDAIVEQYVVEAEARVTRLRRLETAILGCTLAVLLVEGLLIFRPAVRRISETVDRLETLSATLRDAKDEAERANAAKTRFLGNVSHELRTPMTAVLGMTELAKASEDPARREHYLGIVEEAGESLLSLLNDLIDVARIDADQLVLREAPFDPSETIHRIARLMRPTAEAKQVELSVKVDEPIPRVWGDEKRLGQVLLNLVGNAIKWTDEGSVTIACSSEDVADSRVRLLLAVTDTGVGIEPADQPHVFEAFAQAQSPDGGHRGGAGLGLAICQRIVEAMGGSIRLNSTPRVGTTVRVECELNPATAAITLEPQQALVAETRSARVLVVEDTAVNQVFLRETLEQAGHVVTVRGDGDSALAAVAEEDFEVVIADLQLPDADGTTIVRQARQRLAADSRAIPGFVCVTAHAGPRLPAPEDGVFDRVLTKPVRKDELLGAVAEFARRPVSVMQAGAASTPSLEQELVEAFLVAAPPQLQQLRAAVGDAELPTIKVLAHRFAGQVVYFEAGDLRDRLDRLESLCDDGDAEGATRLGKEVVAGLQGLLDTIS